MEDTRDEMEALFPDVLRADEGETLDESACRQAAQKLYKLLARRVERYTMGDHSSVPVELVEELLRSIAFTLEQAGCTGRALAEADLDAALERGQRVIENKTRLVQRRWEATCLGAPDFENIAFGSTLRSIGTFFGRYDVAFFAHAIPCDIDYQLCRPVPDGKLGIAYIEAYLARIAFENAFMMLFDHAAVQRLLGLYCRDYREMVNNLCEPVVTNALGRALLGQDVRTLFVSRSERAALIRLLTPMQRAMMQRALLDAATRLCDACGIQEQAARDDVAWLAAELAPRIGAALPTGDLGGIFLA